MALLPLGTGNDLGRTLGYGAGGGVEDVREYLRTLAQGTSETQVDRWKVDVVEQARRRGNKRVWKVDALHHLTNSSFSPSIGGRKKVMFMQNYLSVGVDALVTYNFHRAREDQRLPISGRLVNKMLFFVYGTKDVLERECKDLDQILDLSLDGVPVELPSVESVVVLNIPCWGAGVRPWQLGRSGNT